MKRLMKFSKILPIAGFSIVFVSCSALEKLNQPISDNGNDPLDMPGMKSNRQSESLVKANNYGFNAGDIVKVVIADTAFFDGLPKTGDRPKKVLSVGDTLRVIGGEKDFIKVVTEKGEVGYVSSVMVVAEDFLNGTGVADPDVTVVGVDETPIIPDVAPDPTLNGLGEPDTVPGVEPAPIPEIDSPLKVDPVPEVPDPKPVEPSVPDKPAPESFVPGLSE